MYFGITEQQIIEEIEAWNANHMIEAQNPAEDGATETLSDLEDNQDNQSSQFSSGKKCQESCSQPIKTFEEEYFSHMQSERLAKYYPYSCSESSGNEDEMSSDNEDLLINKSDNQDN